MRFSLVIPCFNEKDNLVALSEACSVLLEIEGIEVIIVDNGSTDGSLKTLRTLESETFRVVKLDKNAGYGGGILAGLQESRGSIVGWTHADLQTDPADCIRGLELFGREDNRLFVKGARFGRPFTDRAFSYGMAVFESALFRTKMREINAQPTMLSRELLNDIWAAPTDFSFDLYVYVMAQKMGYSVRRFPVIFGNRIHGSSKWDFGWKSRLKFIQKTISYSVTLRKGFH